jgi:hypothetical protein
VDNAITRIAILVVFTPTFWRKQHRPPTAPVTG